MEYVKLKDLTLSTQYGYTAEETSKTEGIYKYLRITDIVPYYVDFATVPYCTIPQSKVDQYLVHEGDVLIARTGATTGYNYVVPKDVENTVYASYLIRFKLDKSRILPSYLKYVLKSKTYYGFVNNYIGGSAQPGMNARVFGRFNVPYNSLPIQRRIASILSAYDILIENNNRRIRLLEQMAENLYKEWFVRFRFPGHEKAEFENGLPKGWKIERLSRIADYSQSKIDSREITLYVSTENMLKDYQGLDENAVIEYPESRVTKVSINDILISNIRPYFKKIWMATQNAGCSNDVLNIRVKEGISPMFLFYSLRRDNFFDHMVAGSNGTKMPRGNKSFTMNYKLLVPTNNIMHQYSLIADKISKEIIAMRKQIILLSRQRDLLLPRLMSGKLEVKV